MSSIDVACNFLKLLRHAHGYSFCSFDHYQSNCCFLQTDTEGFVKEMVGQTSGFMPRDMCALIADAGANLCPRSNAEVDKGRLENIDDSLCSELVEDNKTQKVSPQIPGKEDLMKALERSKKRNASALGTPKVN